MESDNPATVPTIKSVKKRIPKACTACRQSKVKCDGKRPCSRCRATGKSCVFFEVPKDPTTERLEYLEFAMRRLTEQLDDMRQLLQHSESQRPKSQILRPQPDMDPVLSQQAYSGNGGSVFIPTPQSAQLDSLTYYSTSDVDKNHDHRLQLGSSTPGEIPAQSLLEPPYTINTTVSSAKRKRSNFEIHDGPIFDFIVKGLISRDYAILAFKTFFEGCDRYIPIFDPLCDTFESVSSRSSVLLNAICTIGCRVMNRSDLHIADLLNKELKKCVNAVIQNPRMSSLESVQAMLVVACYSSERSLFLSFATRIALDLNLHEAYGEFTQRIYLRDLDENEWRIVDQEEQELMRKARTWFGLLVLEHIFCVDAGKPPAIRETGDTRRCRILLNHPSSTALDLRLLSQVELNFLRAKTNDSLSRESSLDRLDVNEFVRDAKLDLDVWHNDWARIMRSSKKAGDERSSLLVNLGIQKCWTEMVVYFKVLRYMGVENIAAISPTERTLLLKAKMSARRHLKLITAEPAYYLHKLRYAMDFVWAKFAFCFLLLLKLSRFMPESIEENRELLKEGNQMLQEISSTYRTNVDHSHSGEAFNNNDNNIYLQILKLSLEKFGKTVLEEGETSNKTLPDPTTMDTMDTTDYDATQDSQASESEPDDDDRAAADVGGDVSGRSFWELFDAQTDLQSFVPRQFVFEWDFPGLNLFYFPTVWQDFFSDFSLTV